jgi:transposase-like protein
MLAYPGCPIQHRTSLRWTKSLGSLNKGIQRSAGVVSIFPDMGSIQRLIRAVLR